jgi:sortase A
MRGSARKLAIGIGESLCYTAGIALSAFFLSQLALGEVQRRTDLAAFENEAVAVAEAVASGQASMPIEHLAPPNTELWSPKRVSDYQASLQADLPPVLGVLRAPGLGLEVPVYSTDSDLTMDRGAGVIDGMAYPHEGGNIGIAGHRDGYFRALKDIQVGDALELQTLMGPKYFRVSETRIVEMADTGVLEDTDEQTLTLVTCYPFYYVGHAPQRFIVIATLDKTFADVNRNLRRN